MNVGGRAHDIQTHEEYVHCWGGRHRSIRDAKAAVPLLGILSGGIKKAELDKALVPASVC